MISQSFKMSAPLLRVLHSRCKLLRYRFHRGLDSVASMLMKLKDTDQASLHSSSEELSPMRERFGDRSLLDFSKEAEQDSLSFVVVPNFISAEEEGVLMRDVGRSLRGKKYQFDHWDGAIEGYRETEKSRWSDASQPIIDRLKNAVTGAVDGKSLTPLEEVHVLDLAKEGLIKPHIDSVKFCGEVIAGISLLSHCVMKLQHEKDERRWISAFLPQLSLYIMKGVVRYEYTHAIYNGQCSKFKGQPVLKDRRVSIISRTMPDVH